MAKFIFYKQRNQKDCGPTCLQMIAKHHGRVYSIQTLRKLSQVNASGASLLGLSQAAEKIGFRTVGVTLNLNDLNEVQLPCILHWQQQHFVVLYKMDRNRYYIADPAKGLITYTEAEFVSKWISHGELQNCTALLLLPTPNFNSLQGENETQVKWAFILRYFYKYKSLFAQLIFGLLIGTLFSLITPFLTQSVVDVGINTHDLNFVYLILIAQLMLFIGTTSINFLRSWILLHASTRINISILTDFLKKLMKLPVQFFATSTTGDIMQRMNDQQKIETFLTGTALSALFSMVNLLVFTVVLFFYSTSIFTVSLISTILYAGWILIFLKRRRDLNYKQFANSSSNQTTIIELINGMQEIKLNNCEQQKRWGWEHVQARLFNFKVKALSLNQYQEAGSMFINQAKNIVITFLSVKAVIDGEITLGGMMAVQYIVGQVSVPVEQMLNFVQSYQDAKISLERLNEIHEMEDEEPLGIDRIEQLPDDKSITISNLTFRYPGAGNDPVLHDISLDIPQGKVTAIVGMSGSGKTTLLKLLLRFFEPEKGEIKVGESELKHIRFKTWRAACGTVMQDGFIFSDTISGNIAVGDEAPDQNKLGNAIRIANVQNIVEALPFGLHTKIGSTGNGISEGQKQRLLIARAVYKDPEYLFFDEATNSLDANNERVIMENLGKFLTGRTVVVVAHRLSTVSNADNIVVLDRGRIVEQGTHKALAELKGKYYNLVKNQLELGT